MLIKNTKTSKDLNYVEPADITAILREVKQHGFYSAFCTHLVPDIADHDAQISEIKKLAIRAQLRVTFNHAESICIFEV